MMKARSSSLTSRFGALLVVGGLCAGGLVLTAGCQGRPDPGNVEPEPDSEPEPDPEPEPDAGQDDAGLGPDDGGAADGG